MSIHVHLERFEGPLALLLHLIRQEEMDIFDINIHQITTQYLSYIRAMKRLDLEVAGDFVAMAATLLQIKSRMLLPQYGEDGEAIEVEDPRKELVQRLVEYQKFQELSKQLYERPLLGRDVYARGEKTVFEPDQESEIVVEENPLFSLISAYRAVVRSMKKTVHRVAGELQSIASRILEIKDLLVVGQRLRFGQLITETGPQSGQVLVTFLSLLELAKMGFISLFQADSFAEIHLEPKRAVDGDVVSQVEGYENVEAAQTAERLFAEAGAAVANAPAAQLSLEESDGDLDEPMELAAWSDEAASDEEILEEERRLEASEPVEQNPEMEPSPAPSTSNLEIKEHHEEEQNEDRPLEI